MRIGSIASSLGLSLLLVSSVAPMAQAQEASGVSGGACVTSAGAASGPGELTDIVGKALALSSTPGFHNALAFVKGAAVGLASGVAITAGMAALAATAPVWVTVGATVALVGAGLYGITKLAQNWKNMSSEDHYYVAGNIVGGLAAGGLQGTVSRGVVGLLGRAGIATRGAAAAAASAPASQVAAAAAEEAGDLEATAIAARPKLTPDQITSIVKESRTLYDDDALTDVALAAPKAPAMPGLSFSGISSEALGAINDTNLLAGEALGKAPGANASNIWFKQGNPFYQGLTLVIPTERLAALGGEEGVGVAGQAGIVKVPYSKLPGGIPINEFAIVESLPNGYVKPLYVPPNWTGPIGPTLP